MDFLHITNQSDNSADINLYSRIVDGSSQGFINEFQYLDSLGLDTINVLINSKGGDVFEGLGIVSTIQNSKTHTVTINQGIAASTAGWVLTAGNERKSVDFGQVMVHGLSIGGQEAQNNEETTVLNKIKESVVKVFTNNTKMSETEVEELMSGTTFMNAAEALKLGIIDEIISTKREISNSISPNDLLNLVNNNFNENQKTNTMKVIANHLNLTEDANEASILNVVKENETKAAEKFTAEETAHTATKEELLTAQNELKDLKKTSVETSVDNAIEAGTIKKDDRESMITVATESPEAFNTIIGAIQIKREKIVDTIDNSAGADTNSRKDWTIRDFEKKDPEALNVMKSNDFEAYSNLFEATYKSKPSK